MTTPSGTSSRDRSALVLLTSGAAGYLAGRYWFADWQVAVETAQVVAGLVTYPPDNPFFIYHVKLWTVLHQVLAVGLRAGLSERTLSEMLSGLMGMVSFQALAVFVYAVSRDVVLSLATVPLVLVSRAADFGVVYPIFLTGTVHTYGALGLSLVVLTAGLLGCGRTRAGLFLAGLTPAVHPALGVWLALLMAAALLGDVAEARQRLRGGWKYLAAGGLVTATSLVLHLALMYQPPAIPAADAARYQAAFTALWDIHRQPVALDHPGVRLNMAALALSVLWLIAFRRDLPRASWFLLRFVSAGAAIGLGGVLVSWISPERLPSALITLMPGRVLNVAALVFAPLLLALAGACSRGWWAALVAVGTTLGLLVNRTSLLWGGMAGEGWSPLDPPLDPIAVMLAAAATLVAGRTALSLGSRPGAGHAIAEAGANVTMRVVVATVAAALTWAAALPLPPGRAPGLVDRRNDIALATAAAGSGMLLPGGDLYLIQLLTRRPVLINGGALDTMAYAIDSAPAMVRILDDVYGLNLFDPPAEARRTSVIPPRLTRDRWTRYSPERWQRIRGEFGVTQVLTPPEWELQLPLVAQSRRFLLYEIPDTTATR